MRAPLGWLGDYAALPPAITGAELSDALISAGLEVETVEQAGDVTGPLVVGRVLEFTPEPQKNGRTIRWCQVDVGEGQPRGIVCGAPNFAIGDLVVVALPGAVLPGGFAIAARKTYGHLSDGMICSARELGLGEDHSGILVLADDVAPGADAYAVLHLRDEVLDIAVTPDRGYCFSLRGLAREAATALDVAFTDPVDRGVPAPRAGGHPVALESENCAVFVALTVTDLDPTRPSPRWLQRRIQLAGMRPISLVVDVTNYVMLETGQPIHAYDQAKLDGPIVVRAAGTTGAGEHETLTTLDGVARALHPDDLLITDGSGPIGLAGVMGGQTTEIDAGTVAVVIEAAHFDALTLARTSRRHKLASEASRRFERGVDPAAGYAAAHRVAALLTELGGGRISEHETVVGSVPAMPAQQIAVDLPGRILGLDVPADRVTALLTAIGVVVGRDGDRLDLLPPTWRSDLRDPYDYVEEVGRLVGLENIPAVVPPAPAGRGLTRNQHRRRAVTAAAVAAGFVEVLSFPFLSMAELDRLGLAADDHRRRPVRLVNPLAETAPYLRTTLLPGLFAAVARNTSRGNDDLALFETGSVFGPVHGPAPRPPVDRRPDAATVAALDDAIGDQPLHFAAVLAGAWQPGGWAAPAEPAGWRHAVGIAGTVAQVMGLSIQRRAVEHAPWHPGRCAELSVGSGPEGGLTVGWAGELHPQVVAAYGLPARTAAVELDLTALLAAAPDGGEVVAVSPHPVAKEDIALVVDADVAQAVVEQAIVVGAGELLESVRLFDVYTGPQLGPGRKSLAYALRFRAPDRTLTEAEAGAARDAAVAEAGKAVGAVLRS